MKIKLFDKSENSNASKEPRRIPLPFENSLYSELEINYDNYFTHENVEPLSGDEPQISQIKRISFELANLCNYSFLHKKCPATKITEKRTLPATVVYKTIDEMAGINFEGVFAFHRYNEPLIDPRLFEFIKYAKDKCPDSKILILTNGSYLTQEIADELASLGIWILAVSAYSVAEYNRLIQLDVSIPYRVFFSILDNRKDIYEREPINLQEACNAPLSDLTINVNAEIDLCCLDWKNKYTFGNLKTETIDEIINKKSFLKTHHDLVNRHRNLDICKRCLMIR